MKSSYLRCIALKRIFFIDILFTTYIKTAGVNADPYVPKLYASSGIDISICIESGSMKLTTLVDYI